MTAFRSGRNSLDNVIDLVSSVMQEMLRRKITTAVFLDVKGAFDNVSHEAVISALQGLGINGRLKEWVVNYLQDRTIHMTTSGATTSSHNVTGGVPQGGVLSPTLFSITLLELMKKLPKHVNISIYADDMCIWDVLYSATFQPYATSKNYKPSFFVLNSRGLTISPEKTKAMAFTRKGTSKYLLAVDGCVIPYVTTHNFLGFTIDRSLTWAPHIMRLKKKL